MAKIHTAEWTPAVISHPTTVYALRANWFGVAGEKIARNFGRISDSEVISGIPGAATEHYGVPFSLTEEFTSVYRMHPLLPDDFDLRSLDGDRPLQQAGFRELAGPKFKEVVQTLRRSATSSTRSGRRIPARSCCATTRSSCRSTSGPTARSSTSRRPTSCGCASSASRGTASSAGSCT